MLPGKILILWLAVAGIVLGQNSAPRRVVTVPFVGCQAGGQAGYLDAPTGPDVAVPMPPSLAQQLAYYRAEKGVGVLGPRGWYCYGIYGSGGAELFVAPTSIQSSIRTPYNNKTIAGPVIEITYAYGTTSGRDTVAQVIARVFPEYKKFVTDVIEMFDTPSNHFPFGPYSKDILKYKSRSMVEYRTPANAEGLGTYLPLIQKNNTPIHGVAILVGQMPEVNLVLLGVRLPSNLGSLTPAIMAYVEREASRL